MRVQISEDGTVSDVSYDGQGCSISQASTSVLNDLVIGMQVTDALKTVTAFNEMVSSRGTVEGGTRTFSATASRSSVSRSTRHA